LTSHFQTYLLSLLLLCKSFSNFIIIKKKAPYFLLSYFKLFSMYFLLLICKKLNHFLIALKVTTSFYTLPHVILPYHFIHEKVISRQVKIIYVSTSDQLTDILTKSLRKTKFQNFRDRIGDKASNHAQEICKL